MSSALDQFGESLVRASETLSVERATVAGVNAGREGARVRSLRRISAARDLLRRGGWRVPAGLLVAGVLAAAGTSAFGPTGNPREITQIQCGQRGSSAFVTGEPLRDCAILWPSLYNRPAPHLVAWVADSGGVVVVMPAGHPPAATGWHELHRGWKANAAVLGLHLQLEDITTGLEAHQCWSASAADALVTSVLRADGLGSWAVHVEHDRPDGAHPNCLTVISATGAGPHSVLLVEAMVWDSGDPSKLVNTPSGPAEHARLTSTEIQVNAALRVAGRCATVGQAAALWRSRAAAAGIGDSRYVLFTQSGQASPARCARVLVDSPGGGGPADVYAADLP